MKYWVYKESRILGPFDKEAVSGLPGLDSGTLVCAGDPAGSAWVPAGELSDLTGFSSGGAGGLLDDFPSSGSLLDQLQIDSAGLIGDDEFPNSVAENLFQDAAFKKDFQDILSDRISTDESSARHAREKISQLTTQLEAMYRQVTELEAGQADLACRLASKELELRTRVPGAVAQAASSMEAPAVPDEAPVKTFLSPAPPPIPGGPPPVAAVPEAMLPVSEWPATPPVGQANFPSFGGGATPPPSADLPAAPATPPLPVMPSFASAAPPLMPPPPPAPAPPAAAKTFSFGKPKSFKIVPTVKSFKVVGADDAVPAVSANPVPQFKVDPIEAAAPAPIAPPPPPAPIVAAPVLLAPAPVPVPVMAPVSEPAPITNPFSLPSRPAPAALTPVAPPPNTLSRSQPVPDLTSADLGGSTDATTQVPPATMARSAAAADPAAAARFAKPEPAPPTGEIKKPGRNNKPFLIGGGVLVIVLIVVGVILMRQPKDDLKQMATLDDGKAPIGLSPDEGAATPPPIVKPKIAAPAPAPAPPPGPSAEHTAAIQTVKDFPLDGDRGTVGRWLQYSYTASPGAGTEEWNASTTGDNTVLVEYRMVPGVSGGKGALYLFEVDANGIVLGKNIEARQMLAGGPPPEAPKAKKKTPVKKAVHKRRVIPEVPKEVPLLPLPDSGELRPPAEDDGSFGSDTIKSGI